MENLNKNYCPNCQCELMPSDKFCKKCGAVNQMFSETTVAPQPSLEGATTEFVPTQPQTTYNFEQTQAPIFTAPTNYEQTQAPEYTVAPSMLQPTPPEKKKANKGLIATIIVATSVLVIVGVLLTLILTHVICIKHDWKEATCTTEKTCSYCGKTEGSVAGHKWQDATCTQAKTCSGCKKKTGEPLGHTSEWIATSDATLVNTGTEELNCSTCGETLDERDTPIKDAKVERNSFNFKDDEFVQWLEEKSTLEVGSLYNQDEGLTTYHITNSNGQAGLLMLYHTNRDVNQNIQYIVIYFTDASTSALATATIGNLIDGSFSSSTAYLYLMYDLTYESSGMYAFFLNLDSGDIVAVLSPTETSSDIQVA